MFEVNNLPDNFKNYKYIVVKDPCDYTEIEKRFRGYWFWTVITQLLLHSKLLMSSVVQAFM